MEAQFSDLAGNPDLIVATPGRLLHMVDEVEGFTIRSVTMVCLDEADRLLEMGFSDQLRDILRLVAEMRQTLLFSATMPTALAEFVRVGLREPQVIRLDAEMKVAPISTLVHLLRAARRSRRSCTSCGRCAGETADGGLRRDEHHVELL